MKNKSIPLFIIDGGVRLSIEEANCIGKVRLVIHDTADSSRGEDILISCPIEQEEDLARAVVAFNREMRFAKVIS